MLRSELLPSWVVHAHTSTTMSLHKAIAVEESVLSCQHLIATHAIRRIQQHDSLASASRLAGMAQSQHVYGVLALALIAHVVPSVATPLAQFGRHCGSGDIHVPSERLWRGHPQRWAMALRLWSSGAGKRWAMQGVVSEVGYVIGQRRIMSISLWSKRLRP